MSYGGNRFKPSGYLICDVACVTPVVNNLDKIYIRNYFHNKMLYELGQIAQIHNFILMFRLVESGCLEPNCMACYGMT
jgi:hypothetical protein